VQAQLQALTQAIRKSDFPAWTLLKFRIDVIPRQSCPLCRARRTSSPPVAGGKDGNEWDESRRCISNRRTPYSGDATRRYPVSAPQAGAWPFLLRAISRRGLQHSPIGGVERSLQRPLQRVSSAASLEKETRLIGTVVGPCNVRQMSTVSFDESGNTGPDLLNEQQPIFALASVCYSDDEAKDLADLFRPGKFKELKFSDLKKSPQHMANVLRLLRRNEVNEGRVKAYTIHKRFMLVAKIVDLFYEPQCHANGINLYENGAAHGLANLIFTTYPTFLKKDRFDNLLRKVATFIRKGDKDAIQKLRYEINLVYKHLKKFGSDVSQTFVQMVVASAGLEEYLDEAITLDPVIPAFHVLVLAWGRELGTRFNIQTDEKGALAHEEKIIRILADGQLKQHRANYYGHVFEYPLKADSITPVSSLSNYPTQLADIFAGLAAETIQPDKVQGSPLLEELREIIFAKKLIIDGILPSANVMPESLGKAGPLAESPVEYAFKILSGEPSVYVEPGKEI